jgi:hypothetical protein
MVAFLDTIVFSHSGEGVTGSSKVTLVGLLVLGACSILYNLHSADVEHTASRQEVVSVPNADSTPTTVNAPDDTDNSDKEFDGYPCTEDCSGHEAGYDWAQRNDITDDEVCDTAGEHSNSPSFAQGCRAYVEGDSETEPSEDGSDKDPDDN